MKGAYIQMADRFYELHVAGVTRKLPILNVNDKLAIAGFVILGDVELVEKAARSTCQTRAAGNGNHGDR